MKSKNNNDNDERLEELLYELNRILNARKDNKSNDSRKKLYAVARDCTIGIFTKWEGQGGAQESVLGYKNTYHKKFYNVEEAPQFIEMHMTK
eukprot:15353915-Ditylum_brightwellii.AAC.1